MSWDGGDEGWMHLAYSSAVVFWLAMTVANYYACPSLCLGVHAGGLGTFRQFSRLVAFWKILEKDCVHVMPTVGGVYLLLTSETFLAFEVCEGAIQEVPGSSSLG